MVSVSIILIMGVIKYFVSHTRDEHGTRHIPQEHVYSISRLYTVSVTIKNAEVCTNATKKFRLEA